jgi:hypothetical protein
MNHFFCGKGFYIFYFEHKEDRDLIFRNDPYFFGPRGLYLNKWTPYFDPENDIPSVVPVWVRLPHLPFHCWGDEVLKSIGDTLGKFIDRDEPKSSMYSCARICVEVDLEKGLPEEIKLKLDDWTYIQKLDYEQLPFKCKSCHEYGHFSRNCPNNKQAQEADASQQEEGWKQVRKKANTGKGVGTIPGSSGSTLKRDPLVKSLHYLKNPPPKKFVPSPSTIIPPSPSRNSFEILGEPSSRKAPPVGPVLEPLAHSSSSALERISEDSGEEESFHEVNQEEDLQEHGEIPPHEIFPSKSQSNQEMDEGELHLEKPRKYGRRSNKEVREEATSKEKAQGKQQSIESSMYTSSRRGGNKGTDLPVHGQSGLFHPPSMNFLSWNCRGFGNRSKVEALKDLKS